MRFYHMIQHAPQIYKKNDKKKTILVPLKLYDDFQEVSMTHMYRVQCKNLVLEYCFDRSLKTNDKVYKLSEYATQMFQNKLGGFQYINMNKGIKIN